MKPLTPRSGFALVITLVLMAFIVVLVVGYLAATRTDRSTSSIYANRLRAKMIAESGLAAAAKLLQEHTKSGNYITAMPPPAPPPTSIRTEVYRPDSSTSPDDFLRLDNVIGDVLASQTDSTATSPLPQVDPRPEVTPLPAPPPGGSLNLGDPGFTAANSYDFNQVVRLSSTAAGRLVKPTLPVESAFGKWVRVRNLNGDLIGRYAFFIEDESMKINVNTAGNNFGTGQAHIRYNDLASPTPASRPAEQTEEIDPAGVLPAGAGRAPATKALAAVGSVGSRFGSRTTLGLLTDWNGSSATFSDFAHTITALSRADLTTSRGWQRMDLNSVVATNTPPVAAKKIADWIVDSWTGPTSIGALQDYQLFNDERLRLQIAANIVDYIDSDNVPTNAGTVPNTPSGYPVLGIEKIPYLVEVDVIYQAAGPTPDTGSATISMKFRLNFMNLFDTDLRLGASVGKITIKGVPTIAKNGAFFDHEGTIFEIPVGGANGIPDGTVPWGGDNVAIGIAGVKSFYTPTVLTADFNYPPGGSPTLFEAGLLEVDVYAPTGELIDRVKISLRALQAKYSNASPTPNDFLSARQSAASMSATYGAVVGPAGTITQLSFGDPRYRPSVITGRFYNVTRTDITRFTPAIANSTVGDDKADMDSRAYSVDWYDYIGNRPLLTHRDAPMVSIGELGNISACEFPWRTLYLQYAGRSHNTNETEIVPDVQKRRASSAAAETNPALLPFDYVLLDLFKISAGNTANGLLNINTQYGINNDQGAVAALFYGVPADKQPLTTTTAISALSAAVLQRRNAVAALPTGGPGGVAGSPPIDNNPRRPYFTIGELASDMSWLINQSENSRTNGNGRDRTTVNYSVLRAAPTTKSQWNRNYGSDMQVEEPFRKISSSVTTRGNVFRVLYVGQAIKDIRRGGTPPNGEVDSNDEILAEYLAEGFVQRDAVFSAPSVIGTSTVIKTEAAQLKTVGNRAIVE
jgi:hypothetical protein